MRKYICILTSLFALTLIVFILTDCRKEEIVIVYSKIKTVGTSNTTSMTTSVEGLIEELTEATHSEYGVCWDTLTDPTIYQNKSLVSGTAQLGSFTVTLTGLKPAKTYHVRAFVKDNKKYVYGLDLSFATAAANLPVVSTTSATGITSKYAISGGNVTIEGDKPVIAKGVCFDTLDSPTILKNKTMDGWGTGYYTSNLLNLIPSKTYYVRAYAISEFGVSYGSVVTFTTNAKLYSFRDEFSDNTNDWYIGNDTYGSFAVTGGEYVCAYQNTGYLTWTYLNFPDFLTVANNNDFEIDTKIKIQPYDPLANPIDMISGILWNCDNSNFNYFWIKKIITTGSYPSTDYYFTVGNYSGTSNTYTTWKDYTYFFGTDFNRLTIKKGAGNYYFFINDVQVYKHSFTNVSYDGIGFSIQDATLHADYLSIDQKGEKKSALYDLVKLVPGSKGKREFVRSFNIR